MTTILAVGAHPDDLEIGCGAMLARGIDTGCRVVCVDLTDGEETPYGTRELRAQETAASNAVLGIRDRRCLHLPNRVLADTEEARARLAIIMREVRPDIVLSHGEADAHPDHVAAFHITRAAVLLSRIHKCDLPHEPFAPGRTFYFLCSHLRTYFHANVIIPLNEVDFQRKLEAILCYESQFVTGRPTDWMLNMMTTYARYYGSMIRQDYGEPYLSQEPPGIQSLADVL